MTKKTLGQMTKAQIIEQYVQLQARFDTLEKTPKQYIHIAEMTLEAEQFNLFFTKEGKEYIKTNKLASKQALESTTTNNKVSSKKDKSKKDLSWHIENASTTLSIDKGVVSKVFHFIHSKKSEKSRSQYLEYCEKQNRKDSVKLYNYYVNNNLDNLF